MNKEEEEKNRCLYTIEQRIIALQFDENYTSARHQSRNHDGEIIIIIYIPDIEARDKMILNLFIATWTWTDGQISN